MEAEASVVAASAVAAKEAEALAAVATAAVATAGVASVAAVKAAGTGVAAARRRGGAQTSWGRWVVAAKEAVVLAVAATAAAATAEVARWRRWRRAGVAAARVGSMGAEASVVAAKAAAAKVAVGMAAAVWVAAVLAAAEPAAAARVCGDGPGGRGGAEGGRCDSDVDVRVSRSLCHRGFRSHASPHTARRQLSRSHRFHLAVDLRRHAGTQPVAVTAGKRAAKKHPRPVQWVAPSQPVASFGTKRTTSRVQLMRTRKLTKVAVSCLMGASKSRPGFAGSKSDVRGREWRRRRRRWRRWWRR